MKAFQKVERYHFAVRDRVSENPGDMTALLTLAYRCQEAIIARTLQGLRRHDVRGFLVWHLAGSDLFESMGLVNNNKGQLVLHL
jgi:hypothetical protein